MKSRAKRSKSSPSSRRRKQRVLIGFENEDDWFDYRLEHHPEFLRRVAEAREALKRGRGIRLEDLPS
jgi:hypothetical protein